MGMQGYNQQREGQKQQVCHSMGLLFLGIPTYILLSPAIQCMDIIDIKLGPGMRFESMFALESKWKQKSSRLGSPLFSNGQ